MEKARLTGRTILIVHKDVDSALPLQDRIVQAGSRVLTAYSLSRALLIARNARLDDALVDLDMAGASEIVDMLTERRVPHIFCATGNQGGLSVSSGDTQSIAAAQTS